MPRIYTVNFVQQTLANASGDIDLFELTPADDKPIEIVGFSLVVTSELGDAAEELLPLQLIRGYTTSGNGTSYTPTPLDPSDAAAGFSAEYLGATVATTGTGVVCWTGGMNVRIPYDVWFPEGCGPRANQAQTTIVLRSSATVADDVTASGSLFVREG